MTYTTNNQKPIPSDQAQREDAIDTTQSFIVQAPAGSGKTSLLVQRYLALLTQVTYPEEIIAITFTRKAAAEMQDRILTALNNATNTPTTTAINDSAYHNKTLELARQVLQKNKQQQWQLQNCPYRLRLQTIDALCLSLVNAAPFTANLESSPTIAQEQEATKYYKLAAQTLLNELDNNTFIGQAALEKLLLALDNDFERCVNLFVSMLQKREQWLPYVIGIRSSAQQNLRLAIENSLATVANEILWQCRHKLPSHLHQEIIALANFAYNNLNKNNNKLLFSQVFDFKDIFSDIKTITTTTFLALWQQLVKFLLTEKGEWRQTVDSRIGFPAASSTTDKASKVLYQEMKQRHLELLQQLQNIPGLLHNLQEITYLPQPNYSESQWQILCALIELLPLLAAQLDLIFHEHGQVDYTAIALAAERALGNSEAPSDLALHLDYRIKHILVDEFQDISQAQYRLLEKLTNGWENGDGRTLFLVGDPMQSIYRFRQAEVGLFLRAAQDGIGTIKLTPLQLTSNFRSNANIVHWLNETFAKILPPFANIALGCIPFSPAYPNNKAQKVPPENTTILPLNSVNICALVATANTFPSQIQNAEAQHVVDIVQKLQQIYPQESIAILVSARSHLNLILPALKAANLTYNAVALESLNESMAIQDLFTLTRALTDLTDRIAWLAMLRAPWCGLCLSDLHAIANASPYNKKDVPTIWENLINYATNENLSPIGKQLLDRVLPLLQNSIHNRGRMNLREWIETTWLALGGPATVATSAELEHIEQFWPLLATAATSSYTVDINLLDQKLANLYLSSNNPNAQLQIMTIHKAKGLEFDHVIVTGLDRSTQSDSNQLLMWLERPRQYGDGSDLLLAPIKESSGPKNAIYSYLRYIEQQKNYYENGRLLYVATTRAKKTLNLVAIVAPITTTKNQDYNKQNPSLTQETLAAIKTPATNSLLHQLWPCSTQEWLQHQPSAPESSAVTQTSVATPTIITTRLTLNWQHPYPNLVDKIKLTTTPQTTLTATTKINQAPEISDDTAARFGTVVHKCLLQLAQYLTTTKMQNVANYCNNNNYYWQKLLWQNGFYNDENELYLRKIKLAITNILNDPKGRWILHTEHQEAHNEYALAAIIANEVKHLIIDRTFISHDNIRWIIDYKTTSPKTKSPPFTAAALAAFLDEEQNTYRQQLELYAQALLLQEQSNNTATSNNRPPRPIMLGLYFPLCQGWCEWEFKPANFVQG